MSIVSVLGESAVRSLALALAVWLVLRILRVQHARIAKRAWTAVLVIALAMPALVALRIPSFSFTALWATPQTIIVAAPPSVPIAQSFSTAAPLPQTSASSADVAPAVALNIPVPHELQGPPTPVRHIMLWQIGFVAYLTITALLLLRVLLGLTLAARLWRRAQPFTTSETDLPIRLSVDLRSPATVGHGILLPLEAIGWDDAALRATLAHEAQHIREGDFYLQLAATLHHCFFWISPHAWWLRPQLSRLSETICDRAAVAFSGDGLSYAQLLIRFAAAEQTPAGMVAMAQSAGLRERVERLIADPQLTGAFRIRRSQAIAAAALLAGAALVAAASVRIEQPQAVVLAAPQAPTAPAAPQSAPADAAPSPLPPLPPADVVPAPPAGPSQHMVLRDLPKVHIQSDELPSTIETPEIVSPGMETRIIAAPEINVGAAPVIAVGPMAMIQPPIKVHSHVKIMTMPHVLALQSGDNDVIFLNDRNYAICGPDAQGTVHGCELNGYRLKDHKGGAILFERDDKTYVIDDPALVKEARDAYARVGELGKQQGALGEQQGKLGEQQGGLGELEGKLGAMQGQIDSMQWHFDGPDFHFVMPEGFDQAVQTYTDTTTKLALDQKLSDADRARLEAEQKQAQANFDKAMADWKAQQPQREAMEKQIREQTEQIRKQMQPLIEKMRELGSKEAELGRMQGELGRQQALLGMQQRDASREADSKMKSLIDRAMKDGKARPAQ
jgi:beta-lactamase regulating signal transducer with metallopeptidase domain